MNITAYSLHPGTIMTNILRNFLHGSSVLEALIHILVWPFTKSAEAGAQTTIFCATERSDNLMTGHYYV